MQKISLSEWSRRVLWPQAVGAGLAHRVQWLKLPPAFAKLFELPPR
ncbi:MAG: hypothetical protein U0931_35700 [Vulcanimicrobiota bacterium]